MQRIKQGIKKFLLATFWKYDERVLVTFLKTNGVKEGDTVVVHSSWLAANGFAGSPLDFINALKSVLTKDGLLVMMSMPYQNQSSAEFVRGGGELKVRRSASKMGLMTEVFRRGKETLRSMSPTHPVLAWGSGAEDFLADHMNCLEPFGKGSPFEKMLKKNAKIIGIDAPFSTVTFTHFLEDKMSAQLTFSLYEDKALIGKVIDKEGELYEVPVKVLSEEANKRRREDRLIAFFEQEQIVNYARLGNTRFIFMECEQLSNAVEKMYQQNISMFD